MFRNFSTAARVLFKETTKAKAQAALGKWRPSKGDSFRLFAEYRLRAVNQSPLGRKRS